MSNYMIKILHKLNGAKYLERRINRLSDQIGNHLYWFRYLGLEAPLYLLQDGRLALKREQGISPSRVIIISIPKSGTYLISAILEKIGLVNTAVHLWATGFHDYRRRTIPEMIHKYSSFAANLPLGDTVDLIYPGQYTVGHISFGTSNQQILRSFRKIFAVRELRQALVSHMRWTSNEGRGLGHDESWKEVADPKNRMKAFLKVYIDELLKSASDIAGWYTDKDTLIVRFEDLLGDHGVDRQRQQVIDIANHLSIDITAEKTNLIIESVMNKPTKTWSGKRSALNEYWSEDCERIFRERGGVLINKDIGYIESFGCLS